jgi:hypothetical protein
MADIRLVEEVIDLCDIDPKVARRALDQALARSGFAGQTPTIFDIRKAIPELRRALEQVMPPALAYEATERVDVLLDESSTPSQAPQSLQEVTRQLRENNQRLSSRDFEGEVADIEAEIIVRRQRRSLLPPSK